MKTKNNIFNFLKPKNWGIVKIYRDFENFADWKKTIRREEANPISKFSKWKMQRTSLYDVYLIVNLEEEDYALPEVVKRTKILESLAPINRYLDEDLGFAECLNVEFNQFQDDNGKLTLSYLIVYRFRFDKFSLKWLAKFIIVTGAVIFFAIRFDLIKQFVSWLLGVI